MYSVKRYIEMDEVEQALWLKHFRLWLAALLDIDKPGAPVEKIFGDGLPLLKAFPYCSKFVDETLRVKDYHRRKTALRRLAARVTADVEKRLGSQVDYTNPDLLKPHVGRPTKAEQAARRLQERIKQAEAQNEPNLFNKDEDAGEDSIATPVYRQDTKGRTISEIRWLLSPQLQDETDRIFQLRLHFEEECTVAKQMAEDGRKSADIKPHAEEATRCHEAVEKIYERVDHELCVTYVRLKEDSAFIADMATKTHYDNKQLRTLLRPYWDKLSVDEKTAFKARVIASISENDPVQAEQRRIEAEKRKKAQSIVKFITRKDREITARRLKTMEDKLDELRQLIGDDAERYRRFIETERERLQAILDSQGDSNA